MPHACFPRTVPARSAEEVGGWAVEQVAVEHGVNPAAQGGLLIEA